ncbi:RAMP superfamily CRISPR-associated protein [Campylobacter sp. VBCF_05 NA6]|uniref:RAMP superfamily CRISPR-associated protein n=1 Tax=unclassified Campylobacter TaxID=2593542 RepID=UPI0022E9E85B|nr:MULTISPECIES: RAMP superfamily CRISPR-associated protein [unclassified Campylobacter]MDA3057102.1 RAMP superfamily CRISPR-associated protein [Campylobacter sp. VBCF_04 NA7]MDA3059476.1 RAMP superfamily CRISPR-associated protein [Campylobacter sp. VBCF_05 NA6]
MKKRYKLNLKLLSPVHIGTGEVYEPMNFVMDKIKVKTKSGEIKTEGRMFVFDEFEFFKNLNPNQKAEFTKLASDISARAVFGLHSFVKTHKDIAKTIAHKKILAKNEIYEYYDEKCGKIVQSKGGGFDNSRQNFKEFNKFAIEKTYTSPNSNKALILGSSLKGAISTAYQEMLYKEKKISKTKITQNSASEQINEIFKNLLLSDSTEAKGTFVGKAINFKRFKESKQPLYKFIEAILPKQNLECEITINGSENLDISRIARSCNDHYLPIFESLFKGELAHYELSDKFKDEFADLKPQKNQFLLCVGKHGGARAVSIDGLRNIKIMRGKGKAPSFEDEETTSWLINSLPFGWVLCEYNEI